MQPHFVFAPRRAKVPENLCFFSVTPSSTVGTGPMVASGCDAEEYARILDLISVLGFLSAQINHRVAIALFLPAKDDGAHEPL
jgi:hypothetical protein